MQYTTKLTQLRAKSVQIIQALRMFQRRYATPDHLRRYGREITMYFANRPRMRVMVFVAFSLAFVWACTSACLVTAFMSPEITALTCFSHEPPTPAEIENHLWMKLPASAQNMEAYSEGFQDCHYYSRFEMTPADLKHFIDSSLVKTTLRQAPIPSDLNFPKKVGRHVPNWDINAIKSYLVGVGDKNQYHQIILVDTSDATRYVVYVVLSET